MFGDTETFLAAHAPAPPVPPDPSTPPEAPPSASLAPTLLEQRYGADALQLLYEAADDEDLTPEQRRVALEVAGGVRTLQDEDPEIRRQLDEIADHLSFEPSLETRRRSRELARQAKLTLVTPPYIATQAEMEDFSGPSAGGDAQPARDDPYTSVNLTQPADEPEG